MEYRLLHSEELQPSLFSQFDRFQKVTDCWRKRDGVWVVEPVVFTEQWGPEEYQFLCQCLQNTLHTGGAVFGAFDEGVLKGFASVEGPALGSRRQYRDLSSIHVSREFRGKGAGRQLFALACRWAKEHGGEKLYISAHSSVESQAFYRAMGCREAEEYDPAHVEKEPCDCQLEYVL